MSILTHPAFGPRASLIYITVGVLMDVWTAVWYFAFVRGQTTADGAGSAMNNTVWFWLVGLFLTGTALVIIGILLGQIGQAARRAEMPPSEAVTAETHIQQTAAANPPPAVLSPAGVNPAAVNPATQPNVASAPAVIGR